MNDNESEPECMVKAIESVVAQAQTDPDSPFMSEYDKQEKMVKQLSQTDMLELEMRKATDKLVE